MEHEACPWDANACDVRLGIDVVMCGGRNGYVLRPLLLAEGLADWGRAVASWLDHSLETSEAMTWAARVPLGHPLISH